MSDSWEGQYDREQQAAAPSGGGLNPAAQPFRLSAGAPEFTPSFAVPADPPQAPECESPGDEGDPECAPGDAPNGEGCDGDEEETGGVSSSQPAGEAQEAPADEASALIEELKVEDRRAPAATPSAGKKQKAPQEEIEDDDLREHLNIVFIGHVDAGKSTLGGQILYLTGNVDERTIQKYEKEAHDKNRDSWYMAYIMDTNEEERAKGKTVEVGRAHFATEKKRYTILDAPGHKNYVPNMISGAAQADVGLLVIAARRGEFETGFERGGQTREHAQLAKTLGVSKLLVVVNKMDDPSIVLPDGKWSKERFDFIETRLTPFLKSCGYNTKKDVIFLPISALQGKNINTRVPMEDCPWWDKGGLFETLDELEAIDRNPDAPFRMPIIDKYKDMGTMVMGKTEAGTIRTGMTVLLMPNKVKVKVDTIYRDETEVPCARPGENLRIRLQGIDENDVSPGFVLSSTENSVPVVREFEAQLMVMELLEHKAIFSAGYKAVLHIHSVVEECEVTRLLTEINPKTRKEGKAKYVRSNTMVTCRIKVEKSICLETFSKVAQLGRFTLRDEGKTIAIGKVIKLPPKAT
ncbi:unnamed protein product [Ostreobium quekettii]|uniref:Tr-type G domain-containing protein n=1 Tax=Ostreobium quekettii TaxID=121088 RepID=A0A8S1J374_9CHLO|nr:unnamed protein product [Ostreobium quekettii]|eukprot:evm.model.scf_422.3 EVM.evm.TU.scf_422.3   scf_422:8074-13717(+)